MVKLSIIIACYNAADTLSQNLDSIFAQTCQDLEVIIVDGCSLDGTVAVVEGYSSDRIRYIVEEDKGIYDAMNKGVAMAQGEWLLFLGADDRLHDKYVISDMLGSERESKQYDVIMGDIQFDNDKVRKSTVSTRTQYRNTVHHQSAFYRSSLFHAFRYNDTFKVSADYELNLLVFLNGLSVLTLDRVVCVVGLGGASSKVDYCGYAEEIAIRNKYLPRNPSRMTMNFLTRCRYVFKKAGKLVGWNFHYYK
ncbi:MAG: glycosyltransferase [Desulfocapsa sp.]|nr:glycosyltransferase [Desulfocapsa sp.]